MSYTVEGYTLNYDGGLTSNLMLRRSVTTTIEDGIIIWTSFHRNNIPNAAGPGGDNSWTQVYRNVIPGGVGNNEIFTLYYKNLDGTEPSSYTLSRANGSGNESTTAIMIRLLGVKGVTLSNHAYTFDDPSPSIAVNAGELAYHIWGAALNGTYHAITPSGILTETTIVTHATGSKVRSGWQVHNSGGMTGSFDAINSAPGSGSFGDHAASMTSTWAWEQGSLLGVNFTTGSASNTVTVNVPAAV